VDHLARGSMKNAANCASTCELQDTWIGFDGMLTGL
jgi:hypothetical protein